eukprot:CAMPEP_0168762318 /NCGR_PEP_ID=MMETSP0724-20121128/23778_1 /TAXON_ID=265536 /ORGANISM="Amphiprora sp., Strain CCMP467" /LENGTH=220 /DNA_ID=CAMNT_0008811471 /DNA_START=62 /DNA_END=722 /DNA_ORIENTATION=+
MITRFQSIVLLLLSVDFALVEAQCKVRVGVSFANEACAQASMTSALDVFGSYVFELECVPEDTTTSPNDARRLRGNKALNESSRPSTSRPVNNVSRDGPTVMVEMEETSPGSRRLHQQDDNFELANNESLPSRNKQGYRVLGMTSPQERGNKRARALQEENGSVSATYETQHAAVLDPFGMECKMPFGQYVTDVGRLLGKYSTDPNVQECWQYVWCLVYK